MTKRLFVIMIALVRLGHLDAQCFTNLKIDTIYYGTENKKKVKILLHAKSQTEVRDLDSRKSIDIPQLGTKNVLSVKYDMNMDFSDSTIIRSKKEFNRTSNFYTYYYHKLVKYKNGIISETLKAKEGLSYDIKNSNFKYVHKLYNAKGKIIKKETLDRESINWNEWDSPFKDVNIFCAW